MRRYIVTLRHSDGQVAIAVTAKDAGSAVKQVLDFELAPESAVLSVIDQGKVCDD